MPHANVSNLQRQRAKQLRATMTPAETLLWRHIKAHRIDGMGFRRQVPMKNYIADFVCLATILIVELDGESHNFQEQIAQDAQRDAYFQSQGFRVLRFSNEQVTSNLEGVVEMIRQTGSLRNDCRPPSQPLPHKGGGNSKTTDDDLRGNQP